MTTKEKLIAMTKNHGLQGRHYLVSQAPNDIYRIERVLHTFDGEISFSDEELMKLKNTFISATVAREYRKACFSLLDALRIKRTALCQIPLSPTLWRKNTLKPPFPFWML